MLLDNSCMMAACAHGQLKDMHQEPISQTDHGLLKVFFLNFCECRGVRIMLARLLKGDELTNPTCLFEIPKYKQR